MWRAARASASLLARSIRELPIRELPIQELPSRRLAMPMGYGHRALV